MKLAFPALLLIGSIHNAAAQDIAAKLENYAARYSPERAYLHYDKASYVPGETIWFKAYLLNEIVAAAESKNFYVDWIDDKGQILQHTVAPLVNGFTNGQFDIPADYKGGYVAVRAYTKWMLNFDSAFLYRKAIPVLHRDSIMAPRSITIKPLLDFFPESGDAVAGMANKIAFKATDQWGRPITVKGAVVDGSGKFVDSLRFLHDGMGFIMLHPQAGQSYTAKWTDEQKQSHSTPLPVIKGSGAVLQVAVAAGKREFMAQLSADLAAKNDSVHLVGSMYQHPVFTVNKSAKGDIKAVVPTANLPYGILTITLFDQHWAPLAERITYIDNNAPYIFKPEMEVQHWGLSYRARDEVRITVPEAVASSLSVSVTDLSIDADSSDNIISHLMLTSELKGKVHRPAYYFTNPSPAKQQQLDLVMLTNGWRRIDWQKVNTGTLPAVGYGRDTSFMSLSGHVQGAMPGAIGDGSAAMLILTQKDQENKMILMPINRDGSFDDPSMILFDTAKVYYQFQDKSLQGVSLQFQPNKLRTPPVGNLNLNMRWPDTTGMWRHFQLADEQNGYTARDNVKELETVTVKARAKSPVEVLDEKYASGLFTGDAIQLDVLNDPFGKVGDIFTYLQGKVAGLQISGQGANATLSWRGGAPQIYLDESPTDVNMVSSVNINDVAYIKAFRPPFMGGFNGANGAIAIYTRRGGDVKTESKGIPSVKLTGYTPIRQFYSPRYINTQPPAQGEDRDVRTTLYWNPNVTIDPQTRQVVISFYNNDVTDAFRVVIEGMTADGKLAHLEQTME
ncbi:Plug domain-containing protein [Niabella terrae]